MQDLKLWRPVHLTHFGCVWNILVKNTVEGQQSSSSVHPYIFWYISIQWSQLRTACDVMNNAICKLRNSECCFQPWCDLLKWSLFLALLFSPREVLLRLGENVKKDGQSRFVVWGAALWAILKWHVFFNVNTPLHFPPWRLIWPSMTHSANPAIFEPRNIFTRRRIIYVIICFVPFKKELFDMHTWR